MPRTTKQPPTGTRTLTVDRVATYPRRFAGGKGWLSQLASEQVHVLATHVLAQHAEKKLRTLAVTSALAGEGKTSVTLALAEKLASADRRILVVDFDTHRATLTREAELEDVPGAIESAAARSNGTAAPLHCYATERRNVSVMPTGRLDEDQGAPIPDLERLQALLDRAREEYDLVILDCPPLLPVADTHVFGELADRAILVVRAGATPKQVLEQALLEFGREKFMAGVLNRAQPANIPYFREVYGYYRRPSK